MGGKFNTFVATLVGGAAVVSALTIGAGEDDKVAKAWAGAAGAADVGASYLQKGSNLASNVANYAGGAGISPSEYSDPRQAEQILNGSTSNNGEITIVPAQSGYQSFVFRPKEPNIPNMVQEFNRIDYKNNHDEAPSSKVIGGVEYQGAVTTANCNVIKPVMFRYTYDCVPI